MFAIFCKASYIGLNNLVLLRIRIVKSHVFLERLTSSKSNLPGPRLGDISVWPAMESDWSRGDWTRTNRQTE